MESLFLREEIRHLQRLLYAPKSEKLKKIEPLPNQPTLFEGQDESKEIQEQETKKEALVAQFESENASSNDPP